jgi:hypothetical protein
MNRWSGSLLRVAFAFVIVFLAGIVSLSVRAIFHSESDRVTGILFLVATIFLVLFFERVFPSVYSGSVTRATHWWQMRVVIPMAFAIIVSILSSRMATLWFGLLIISGVLVALFLHVSRRDGEL